MPSLPFPQLFQKDFSLKAALVFVLFLFVTVFIRLPFFFRDYVDQDESTFILVAQSWVDGHLPYTELWDLKPPVVFLFFTLVIKVFGKSFVAIRFFGCVLVALTAFFTFKLGESLHSKLLGFWSGVATLCFLSLFGSVQGVMSEHIATVFFMGALWLLASKDSLGLVFLAGIAMGMAFMAKLNLGYAMLVFGPLLLYWYKNPLTKGVLLSFIYGMGALVPLLFFGLHYYNQDAFSAFYDVVFGAPLRYAASKEGSVLDVLPFGLVLGVLAGWAWRIKLFEKSNLLHSLIWVSIGAITFSFFRVGKINGHYLIQIYPLLILVVAMLMTRLPQPKKKWVPYLAYLLFLVPMESYLEYVAVAKNYAEKGRLLNGEGVDVPFLIQEKGYENKNVYFMDYHIGYWMLGTQPPSKIVTHPTNIFRQELIVGSGSPRTSSQAELQYIFEEKQPELVIRRHRSGRPKNVRLMPKNNYVQTHYKNEIDYLESTMRTKYRIIDSVGKARIYQRIQP
ncbi:ArnT family glycosyltransferase [Sediminicola luteus]|uniref:Glycosyltransferase RgtA/B/C/D-like domain-containing protein n=1 Tax=Sediminicola luteus TaxID=319238 RepID=A0A2A4G4X7_9FLAO|nr:glycosyltransferase family 39 protein [Sediminicola luteus]PCE62785.1 hypothetical protein B7P33_15990 [Sediminicola luteus]